MRWRQKLGFSNRKGRWGALFCVPWAEASKIEGARNTIGSKRTPNANAVKATISWPLRPAYGFIKIVDRPIGAFNHYMCPLKLTTVSQLLSVIIVSSWRSTREASQVSA